MIGVDLAMEEQRMIEGQHEWTHLDRSGWRWDPCEPDVIQWRDSYTGYRCMMNRMDYSGTWCGYVGVDESHTLWGLRYSDTVETPEGWEDEKCIDFSRAGLVDVLLYASGDRKCVSVGLLLDVHGGLTFSGATGEADMPARIKKRRPDDPEILDSYLKSPHLHMCWVDESGSAAPTWWLGFDCAHLDDDQPAGRDSISISSAYRTRGYVESQVTSLAAQVKRLEEGFASGGLVLMEETG